ncbi:MAG: hypothetical protein ACLPN1_14175 [Dissulfurispiraceae bacterium]
MLERLVVNDFIANGHIKKLREKMAAVGVSILLLGQAQIRGVPDAVQ